MDKPTYYEQDNWHTKSITEQTRIIAAQDSLAFNKRRKAAAELKEDTERRFLEQHKVEVEMARIHSKANGKSMADYQADSKAMPVTDEERKAIRHGDSYILGLASNKTNK